MSAVERKHKSYKQKRLRVTLIRHENAPRVIEIRCIEREHAGSKSTWRISIYVTGLSPV